MSAVQSNWLTDAVATFGHSCKEKLLIGWKEANLRKPVDDLLMAMGSQFSLDAVLHDEVPDSERRVRLDYAVRVNDAITGYVELKAPGKGIDPDGFNKHDREQWERLRDMPNLLYTNGTSWRLYRSGALVGDPLNFTGGPLTSAGSKLVAPPGFTDLIKNFLEWDLAQIASVTALVRQIAPLTRLLRGEVLDQLKHEEGLIGGGADEDLQPFHGLARDWRELLFPLASNDRFADGYAQTVTFALLLARSEGIDIKDKPLHQVGDELGPGHSLMGKALQLFTDNVAKDFGVTLEMMVRTIGQVDWPEVRKDRRDTYLHLYETFLEAYDKELREESGTYYTPRPVVDAMVRLVEEALHTHLGKKLGFRDEGVLTLDPALGTGTYLHTILERAAHDIEKADGLGNVGPALADFAKNLMGFELQMGPYAVAELRINDLLTVYKAEPPSNGMQIYVTDTLDDPEAELTQLGSGLETIAQQRKKANSAKRDANVRVVIGNPPYDDKAQGRGAWVESGSDAHGKKARAILDDFRMDGNGRNEYVLKSMYVYFWRWATWKVWESTKTNADDGDAGVVCFITTAGYLRGRGFKGMREYLRRNSSEGWIIDLTPEGQRPDVPTRIFPSVQQPLAIGLFIRKPETSDQFPAEIRYRAIGGLRQEKFDKLSSVRLGDGGWRGVRDSWIAPLTPSSETGWDGYPALEDLLPWTSPGVKPNRTWVYAPSIDILNDRWNMLRGAPVAKKAGLFLEKANTKIDQVKTPLPGIMDDDRGSVLHDQKSVVPPVRVGYRSFDRQWLIPDARLIERARPDLWNARCAGQVFIFEQHSVPINDGPGLVFSALLPDQNSRGSEGGRVVPLIHPDGSANVVRGLLHALGDVSAEDLVAYVAAVVAHPAYTAQFADELTTPGVRVPITEDPDLWAEAVELGRTVIWLHTYGESFAEKGGPKDDFRYPEDDVQRPKLLTSMSGMPETITYREADSVVALGDGEFGPVPPAVWNYTVGGKPIVKEWFKYRKKKPGGKKSSDLDDVHVDTWPSDWTKEFNELLTVLRRLTELEAQQADLLDRILAGLTWSMPNLEHAGVHWPKTPKDRAVRYSMTLPTDEPTLDFG